MMELFDLVNSFIEKGYGVVVDGETGRIDDYHNTDDGEDSDVEEMKNSLKRLFEFESGGDNDARRKATVEVHKAWRRVIKDNSSPSSPGFKLQLMAQLRDQGFDAGLCKSKWEKNGKLPSGDYEYVDIDIKGSRYIIDVSLAGEFEIARPTESYISLLNVFPKIAICKVKELKRIVRIMCDAIKKSMKQQRMPVPPWRKHGYVQAKWFGSYDRITDEIPAKSVTDSDVSSKNDVGYLSFPSKICYCNEIEDFGVKKFCFRVGNLAMAMNGAI